MAGMDNAQATGGSGPCRCPFPFTTVGSSSRWVSLPTRPRRAYAPRLRRWFTPSKLNSATNWAWEADHW